MFANKKRQEGAVYAYILLAAALISTAIFMFASNMTSFVFLSRNVDEKTKVSSTITVVSEAAKDYFRKKLLEGTLTAFPVETGQANAPMNGGLVPKNIPSIKTDPWGTRIGVCSYFLGDGVFPAAFGSSSNGIVRGNNISNMKSVIFAIVLAGKNKVFETECASVSGSEVRPQKGGDDIVWMFSVNQVKIALDTATASGPSLIQGYVDSYAGLSAVSAVLGDTYLVTGENSLYWYNGSAWNNVGNYFTNASKTFDLPNSNVTATVANTTADSCNTTIPIEIYNNSNTDSFGKPGITSSKAIQIFANSFDYGKIAIVRSRHESSTPCGDEVMTLSANSAIGLYHRVIGIYYTSATVGGLQNYSFEDNLSSIYWTCSIGCTNYSSTLSTKKNRRDGYRYFAPDNGVNQEIYASFFGAVAATPAHVVTFDYSPSPGGTAETNGILVYVTKDGVNVGQLQVAESGIGMQSGSANWKRYSFSVTLANATGIRLYVKATGSADGISGLIDNIRFHKADDIRESNTVDSDFVFYNGIMTFGGQAMGVGGGAEGGVRYRFNNNMQFDAPRNWNSTQKLFTFNSRTLPASDFISPGYYGVDGTTSPGTADLVRSNQLIDTAGPVTNDKCTENGYNFNAGAVISDYYGNVYVCQ